MSSVGDRLGGADGPLPKLDCAARSPSLSALKGRGLTHKIKQEENAMRRLLVGSLATLALVTTLAATEDIVLRGMGSFHIGGRLVEISGKPVREVTLGAGGVPARLDPNGLYQVEAMYVQYFLPKNRKGKVPLLMWHGGGLTGVTYETTPDGREGWLNMFIRAGWDVYNSDAVERGRSGFASRDVWPSEPNFLTTANPYERFRIGAGAGSFDRDPTKRKPLPGNLFPPEGYDNFVKQIVPRWIDTDNAIIAAYTALIDKVCPCVILFHSQAGAFGFKVAQARPDKVKALIAVEPAVAGDKEKAATLKDIPIMVMYGDYIEQDSRWPRMRQGGVDFIGAVRAAGGRADVVNLPEVGIKGNSHMLMMDKNNAQLAALINTWLKERGLMD
jgi:pimeloyl-ACP methyl ester carboxylesterase